MGEDPFTGETFELGSFDQRSRIFLGVFGSGMAAAPMARPGPASASAGGANLSQAGGSSSRVLFRTNRSLQKFFDKHGDDFGLAGNWNKGRGAGASRVIHQHVNSPGVQQIPGRYLGEQVTHHLDPRTGLNVIEDAAGNFISGWRLGREQLQSVVETGRLF